MRTGFNLNGQLSGQPGMFPTVDFKAVIDMWVGAEFGAEIEFMKWKLTSPKIQFKILNENLLTWPKK